MGNLTILSGLLSRTYKSTSKSFTLENFNDRLRCIKVIYLLQAFGITLGYNFSWYIRGPYSTPVMDDLYTLYREYTLNDQALPDDIIFKGNSKTIFKNFLYLMKEVDMDPYTLEMLASIHFIEKTYGYKNIEDIRKALKNSKTVDDDLFNLSYDILKRYGLI